MEKQRFADEKRWACIFKKKWRSYELRVEAHILVKNDKNSYLIKATCSPVCYRHEVDSSNVYKWLMKNARGLNSS